MDAGSDGRRGYRPGIMARKLSEILIALIAIPLTILVLPVLVAALPFLAWQQWRERTRRAAFAAAGFRADAVLTGPTPQGTTSFAWAIAPPEAWIVLENGVPTRATEAPAFEDQQLRRRAEGVLRALAGPVGAVRVTIEDAGPQKLQAIRAVREAGGLGLREAKDAVDSPGTTMNGPMDAVRGRILAEELAAIGGRAKVEPT